MTELDRIAQIVFVTWEQNQAPSDRRHYENERNFYGSELATIRAWHANGAPSDQRQINEAMRRAGAAAGWESAI